LRLGYAKAFMSEMLRVPAFSHVSSAQAKLYRVFARPRVIAFACLASLALLGWGYLGWMIGELVRTGHAGALGLGMGWLDSLASADAGSIGRALVDALCRAADPAGAETGGWSVSGLALGFAMWCAMTLAMMLPSAGGMIATYADIADTAAAEREPVVSPLVLIAGFAAVWFGFALLAAALQAVLAHFGASAEAGTRTLLAGAFFVGAGAYQFSALKHACLRACQQPFPFFFANWTTHAAGVFRLGLRQGAFCVGCCWAMMLLMFAAGVMNVLWMAMLGIVMTIEKGGSSRKFPFAVGLFFLIAGFCLIATGVLGAARTT
jgi:predicted metal-binding membrane protein